MSARTKNGSTHTHDTILIQKSETKNTAMLCKDVDHHIIWNIVHIKTWKKCGTSADEKIAAPHKISYTYLEYIILSFPAPFTVDTWRRPKRQLSFGAQPSFLPTGLLYVPHYVRLVELDLRVNFYFSPILCFLFPFGSRAIWYYSSTRTTAAAQTSNCLESEEYSLFAVRSIYPLCRLHGPLGADV